MYVHTYVANSTSTSDVILSITAVSAKWHVRTYAHPDKLITMSVQLYYEVGADNNN